MRSKRILYMASYQRMSTPMRWLLRWWYHNRAKPTVLDRAVLLLTPASFDADNGIWYDQSGYDHHFVVDPQGDTDE